VKIPDCVKKVKVQELVLPEFGDSFLREDMLDALSTIGASNILAEITIEEYEEILRYIAKAYNEAHKRAASCV